MKLLAPVLMMVSALCALPHAQQPAVVLEHLLPFLAATRPTTKNPGPTDA